MPLLTRLTQRINGRMFEQPDFIRRIRRALGGEILHGLPGGRVIGAAELANNDFLHLQHHFDHRMSAKLPVQIIELLA